MMRLLLHFALFFLGTSATISFAQVVNSGPVDLYVLAGQSNARGHVSYVTKYATGSSLIPAPYNTIYGGPVTWAQEWNSGENKPSALNDSKANAFGTSFVPYNPGYYPGSKLPDYWGPEVAFVAQRYANNGNLTVYLLKYAVGATAVANIPKQPNWNVAASGDYFLLGGLEARVNAATQNLLASGYSNVVVHLLWDQGEEDQGIYGVSYLQNFSAMFNHFTANVTNANVTTQLDSMTLVHVPISRYANASINIAATNFGAQMVNTIAYASDCFLSDKIHLIAAGQVMQGEQMELNSRTKPRLYVDNTLTDITTLNFPTPTKVGKIAYLPTVSDGTAGIEMLGTNPGLTLDPLFGTLSVTDLTQIQPGVTLNLTIRRHTPVQVTDSIVQLTFH